MDLTSPGVDVWTTSLGGGYAGYSGTSLSTPLANGVASLLWAANPYLDSYEVENRLYESCDDLGAPGEDNVFGWGRTNMNLAVHAAVEGDMVLDAPALSSGSSATFTVSGAPASTNVYLAYSLTGQGVTDIAPLQTTIGLDSPVRAGLDLSTPAGNASFTRGIPSGGAGVTVWIQAVTMGDTSNVEARTIL